MDDARLIKKYLPLTESTYYIMLSLVEPLHGYGIMQNTQKRSKGKVNLGPGTLYGALGKLEREGLITLVGSENRRKSYQLTGKGRKVLRLEMSRLEGLVRNGLEAAKLLDKMMGGVSND